TGTPPLRPPNATTCQGGNSARSPAGRGQGPLRRGRAPQAELTRSGARTPGWQPRGSPFPAVPRPAKLAVAHRVRSPRVPTHGLRRGRAVPHGARIMLSLLGPGTRLCDGVTRREALRVGGLGLLGLTWAGWLR